MGKTDRVLVCWHSVNHGEEVLERALSSLRRHRIEIDRVMYLVQEGHDPLLPRARSADLLHLKLGDPTDHGAIYQLLKENVIPRLRDRLEVHINISPGTPAMHAVWLILHAGGAFPPGTKLWSSQYDPASKRTRLDEVNFGVTTYLSEIRKWSQLPTGLPTYDPEARSRARREALQRLKRYAQVAGAPLLVLGERGTGKTRLIEQGVLALKGRKKVVTLPCGGLDSALAESLLFGHVKGAFTGAIEGRKGLLCEAKGGILFLDEIQDLPSTAQRKLVRVLQDRRHLYRPLGSNEEEGTDAELVCASNQPLRVLREKLDADLFDRLSHLVVTIPPLRECREDLREDWEKVWMEARQAAELPATAPWSSAVAEVLQAHPLLGNLRDLQRLAFLIMALGAGAGTESLEEVIREWRDLVDAGSSDAFVAESRFGTGTREERIRWFRGELAKFMHARHGTWSEAAQALSCDEKTLRKDGNERHRGDQQ